MGIDSLGGTKGLSPVKPVESAKNLKTAAPERRPEEAAQVRLMSEQLAPVVASARAQVSKADEARLSAIKEAVRSGSYPVDPSQIARSMMEERSFFEGVSGGDA